MSTPKTRAYGAAKDLVLMQGKVSPEVRERVQVRADELGMSQARYLEFALRYVLDNDIPVSELPEQEQLPMTG